MPTTAEPAVTVCVAACDFESIWLAQYYGYRNLVLSGRLGGDVVTLPDTVIEADGATLDSLYVAAEAPRVTVRNLTVARGGAPGPLVTVAAVDATFEGLTARHQDSPQYSADGDILHLLPRASATLVDPSIVDNLGSGAPVLVGNNASLTLIGGRIDGNGDAYIGAVSVDRGTLNVEQTVLGATTYVTVQGLAADITLTDVTGSGTIVVFGGAFTLRGGTWGGGEGHGIWATGTERFEIDGATTSVGTVQIAETVGETRVHAATLQVGALTLLSVPSAEITDTWFCPDLPIVPVSAVLSCAEGCDLERVVVQGGSAPMALELSGDVALRSTTVVGAPWGPGIESSGGLTLDRVLMVGHGTPAATAEPLDVESSGFATLQGLEDRADGTAVDPAFRGTPTGPCGLDLQLADVPQNDWLIANRVGAFPACWTDLDGDGAGDGLADLQAPADVCPAGTAPAPGDCDDDDPTVDRICDPPMPTGDPTRRSSRAGGGRCDAGPAPAGLLASLCASLSLFARRRRPGR